jgi:hypothetical protein
MAKKLIIGILIVVLFAVVGYGFFWLRYFLATEESNKETVRAKCDEGIAEAFTGTIFKLKGMSQMTL